MGGQLGDRLAAAYEERPWQTRIAVSAAVGIVTILIGAVIGTALVGGGQGPSRRAEIARLEPAGVGEVLLTPGVTAKRLAEKPVIASQKAGITILGLGEVDEVVTGEDRRRPPEGGRLIAVELGDGPCEAAPCESWRTLEPRVLVNGTTRELPEGGDSFVIVVPAGLTDPELIVDADGFEQSLSLADGTPGADNIDVLTRPADSRKVALNQRFPLLGTTSVALAGGAGAGGNEFVRDVALGDLELRFFVDGRTPSNPRRAFLVLRAAYSPAGGTGSYAFDPDELAFVAKNGTRSPGLDLDPDPSVAVLGFEVAAGVRAGTLTLGGETDLVSTTGIPYVMSLEFRDIPVTFD